MELHFLAGEELHAGVGLLLLLLELLGADHVLASLDADLSCHLAELKGVGTLLVVHHGGIYHAYNRTFGVLTQTLLQYPGQLRIPKVNPLLIPLTHSLNNLRQCQYTLINILPLYLRYLLRLCPINTLTTSQVDQVYL